MIEYRETSIDRKLCETLIALSEQWENEDISYGYIANKEDEFDGKRIFIAESQDEVIGYLFGHEGKGEMMASAIGKGKRCFQVDEFYIRPEYRDQGIGSKLFGFVQSKLDGFDFITLGTSTKNYKAILHFYIEELGMSFHSAALFKKIKA